MRSSPLSTRKRTGDTIVLGIDPGTLTTGYGVVRRNGRGLNLLACGAIRTRPRTALPERLLHIHRELLGVIKTYHPDMCAIESAFYGKNAQSALKLGHARGISLLAAAQRGVATAEYSPGEIKKAVVGRGAATKDQVQFMVRSILGVRDTGMMHDASDAIAVALCHLQRDRAPASRYRSWSAFVNDYPERVRR